LIYEPIRYILNLKLIARATAGEFPKENKTQPIFPAAGKKAGKILQTRLVHVPVRGRYTHRRVAISLYPDTHERLCARMATTISGGS
jgi:hypothetical protein